MAKQYSGTVSRERVMSACEALGLKPDDVFNLNITGDRVRVIEFQRDTDGARIYNPVLETYDKRSYALEVK